MSPARLEWMNSLRDLGVDLVLSGHDHLYSRSRYMNGETETDRDSGLKMPGEVLYVSGGRGIRLNWLPAGCLTWRLLTGVKS